MLKFYIQLLVRSYPEVLSSTFSIGPMAELNLVGIDVAVDNVLFNLVTKDTELMRCCIPWKRRRKKDHVLFQLLIESTSQVSEVVLNCTASIDTWFLVNLSFMALSFLIMTLSFTPPFIFRRSICPRLSQGQLPFCGHGGG